MVRLFGDHEPSQSSVEMHHLPVRHVPALLNAVGATLDLGLRPFQCLPEDYEGEAARWLAEQLGDAIGIVGNWPVLGSEDDPNPSWYTQQLSTCWSGPFLELPGPSLDAPCILRMYQLTDTAAHAVITALTRTAYPKTPKLSTGPARVPPMSAAEGRSTPGPG
ncbi:hypothetical protein [Streptomyces amakusaensis]|uniref:Uncharacterized protein n=1 Tax=Streptomyces amakusaensis TaxID=67271 RepID=A0ABW0AJW6_9ACTN